MKPKIKLLIFKKSQEKVLNAITETARFIGSKNQYSEIVKGLTIDEDEDLKVFRLFWSIILNFI